MSAGPDLSLLSHEQKDALIHTLVAQVAALRSAPSPSPRAAPATSLRRCCTRKRQALCLLRPRGTLHSLHDHARRRREGPAPAGGRRSIDMMCKVYNVGSFNPSAVREVYDRVLQAFPDAKIAFKPDPRRQSIVDSWPDRRGRLGQPAGTGNGEPNYELSLPFEDGT